MLRKLFLRSIPAFLLISGIRTSAQSSLRPTDTIWDPFRSFAPLFPARQGNLRTPDGRPGPSWWQNQADYRIEAVLDTLTRVLKVDEYITYHNNSQQSLPFIWVQLEQNIYRKDSRNNLLEPWSAKPDPDKEYTSGFVFREVRGEGRNRQANLTAELDYQVYDATMKINLPAPLRAGDSCRIFFRYSFTLPKNGSNIMGVLPTRQGSVFQFSDWYPKVAVFDDLSGWNPRPQGFYADPGKMDIRITLPAGMLVGSSGQLCNPEEVLPAQQAQRFRQAKTSNTPVMIRSAAEVLQECQHPSPGTKTWHFQGEQISGALWAASRSFIWDGMRIDLPQQRTAMAMSLYPVEYNNEEWRNSTKLVRQTIESYSRLWTPYPFPAATNVAGSSFGVAGNGISLITAASGMSNNGVVAKTNHEIGHSWFPFIVCTNGLQFWMQEGLNSFINDVNGDSLNISTAFDHHSVVNEWLNLNRPFLPVSTPLNLLRHDDWAYCGYVKPTIALRVLRNNVLGPARFDNAFRGFIQAWTFRHPCPEDFFRYMENAAGEDLSWFWRGWFLEDAKLDQAIIAASYPDGDPAKGIDITVRNRRSMVMPLDLEFRQIDGTIERVRLPAESFLHGSDWKFHYPSSTPVSVLLDPDRQLPDLDRSNNDPEALGGSRQPIPSGMTAQAVLDRYFKAAGGREKLEMLDSLSWGLSDTTSGSKFYINWTVSGRGHVIREAGFHSPEFCLSRIDRKDTVLHVYGPGNMEQFPEGARKEQFRNLAALFPELNWNQPGYTVTLSDSTAQLYGIYTYVLNLTDPAGEQWRIYYACSTGLKLREEHLGEESEIIQHNKTDFLQYLPVNGILLPHTLIQTGKSARNVMRTVRMTSR